MVCATAFAIFYCQKQSKNLKFIYKIALWPQYISRNILTYRAIKITAAGTPYLSPGQGWFSLGEMELDVYHSRSFTFIGIIQEIVAQVCFSQTV